MALAKAVESADGDVTFLQQSIASLRELIAQKQAELAALYYCPAVEEPAEIPEEPVDPELETMPNI